MCVAFRLGDFVRADVVAVSLRRTERGAAPSVYIFSSEYFGRGNAPRCFREEIIVKRWPDNCILFPIPHRRRLCVLKFFPILSEVLEIVLLREGQRVSEISLYTFPTHPRPGVYARSHIS